MCAYHISILRIFYDLTIAIQNNLRMFVRVAFAIIVAWWDVWGCCSRWMDASACFAAFTGDIFIGDPLGTIANLHGDDARVFFALYGIYRTILVWLWFRFAIKSVLSVTAAGGQSADDGTNGD